MNKAFARVTGGKVNRGAGYGLEIQCVYEMDQSPMLTRYEKFFIL